MRTSFLKPYQKLHPMAGHQNHPPIDPVEEERIRNETWIRAVGGKSTEGRIYDIGQVTYNSTYVDKLIYHGSSSHSQDFIELKQEVQTYKDSNDKLSQQVQSLVKVIQTLLPPDARTVFQQEQEQHQPSSQHEHGSQGNNEHQNQDQDKDDHPHYSTY